MHDRPRITTALPKARYRIADYTAILLGDIDSPDLRRYRYLLAFIAPGRSEPNLYVSCEYSADPAHPRAFVLRVIGETLSDVLDCAEHWGEREVFVEQALTIGCQALGLERSAVIKLM